MAKDKNSPSGVPGFVDDPRESWMKIPAPTGAPVQTGSPLAPLGAQPAMPVPPIGEAPIYPSDRLNWMGTTSLALIFFGGGLPGIVMAILGLRAVKRGQAGNRDAALIGLIVNGIILMIVMAVVVVAIVDSATGPQRKLTLDVGDCFDEPAFIMEDGAEVVEDHFVVSPCDERHYGQVYYQGVLTDVSYPSNDELEARIDEICYDEVEGRVNLDYAYAQYYSFYYPTRAGFSRGEKSFECYIFGDRELVGSVLLDS